MSSFLDVIDRARALLEQRGRISLRVLRREFSLEEEKLEDLVEELVEVERVASREGSVLIWAGGASAPADGAAGAQPDGHSASHAPSEPRTGERRQLTVMFCDLLGSTELAQRIDPEELGDVLHKYRKVCVDASERVGGHVAQYLGDGVLIYFGYPQAHEDAAARAIRAGLEIQRILRARLEKDRIEARIGIHTGLVVVDPGGPGEEALALGPTTNLASRIEGMAKPGTVVVSDATLSLCRGGFVTRSLGEVALKGIAEPVRLHEVEALLGVWSYLGVASSKPMVGRDRELTLLLDRWRDTREGRGQAVLVSGEAGMGKTRLIQGLREGLAEGSHLWIEMHCSPFTSGSAFQPLVDLQTAGLSLDRAESPEEARDLVVRGIESVRGVRTEQVIPYVLPLLSLPPSERYPLLEASADEQRERTFRALLQLMLTLSELQPVVFVAEDLHWSDPSTLEFLGRLVERAAPARLLLVLTFREEYQAPWFQAHVSRVKLGRLSERSAREMIVNAAGRRLPEPVLAELESRSDGVPVFIHELTANLVSSGLMIEKDGSYELRGSVKDLAIPTSLQDSLMARLDRLNASKQVAQQAASLGREFSFELIEAISDLDARSLRDALSQLVAAEILHQRGIPPAASYSFRHSLLQDTAYESQLYSTRRALHARIAKTLQERFPARVESEPEVMARHFAAAGLSARALDHYQRAAELAAARLSNREAAEHYALALDALAALPEDADRHQREIAIRLARANALMLLGSYDSPEVLEDIARVEELGKLVGEGPQQLPALLGLVQFDIARGDNLNSRERAQAILRIAEPLGVSQLMAAALLILGGCDMIVGSSIEGRDRLARAVAIGQVDRFLPPATPHDIDLLVTAHFTHAMALVMCAQPDQALVALAASRERALRFGNDYSLVQCMAMTSMAAYLMRDPKRVIDAAEESLRLGEGRGFHTAQLMATVTLGWALAAQGEVEEGVRDVEHGLRIAQATGSLAGVGGLYVAAAEVHTLARNRKRAEELLDGADEILERRGETTGYGARVLCARAQLELELGDGKNALAVEAMLLDALGQARRGERLLDELVACTQLAQVARWTSHVPEAHQRLTEVYARLTEGFDRQPVVAAMAAMDELARAMSSHQRPYTGG